MFNPQLGKTSEALFCQGCRQAISPVLRMDAHRLNVTGRWIMFFHLPHAVSDALALGIHNHQIQFRLIGRGALK